MSAPRRRRFKTMGRPREEVEAQLVGVRGSMPDGSGAAEASAPAPRISEPVVSPAPSAPVVDGPPLAQVDQPVPNPVVPTHRFDDEETLVKDRVSQPAGGNVGLPWSDLDEEDDDAPTFSGDDEPKTASKPAAVSLPRKSVAPSGPVRVRFYGRTDVGQVREHNEDNFLVANLDDAARTDKIEEVREVQLARNGVILAVCDGMGGAAAGEVASQMAVDTVYEVMTSGGSPQDRDEFAHRLVRSIEEAGTRIFSAAKLDRTRRGMGTTATVAGLVDNILFVGEVGDSRAYVLREDKLEMITKDQSLVNQLIEAGQLTEEEAEAFEHSNIILQALGTTEDVSVDLTFLELRRGDRLMMCSDGLSGLVHGDVIRDVLAGTKDIKECSGRLIELANAGGGHDNITVIVADFDGEGLPAPSAEVPVVYQQYPLPEMEPATEPSVPGAEAIKEGGPKPGADVKKSAPPAPAAAAAVVDESPSTGGSSRLFFVGFLVILVVVGVVAALILRGGDSEPEDAATPPRNPPVVAPEVEPRQTPTDVPVQVTVDTDINGVLFVGADVHGELHEGQPLVLELAPGAYRLEARSDGNAVATQSIHVVAGQPMRVQLMLPSGVEDDPEPPTSDPQIEEDPVQEESEATDEPEVDAEDRQQPATSMRQAPVRSTRTTRTGGSRPPPNPF